MVKMSSGVILFLLFAAITVWSLCFLKEIKVPCLTPPIPSLEKLREWNEFATPPRDNANFEEILSEETLHQLKDVIKCNDKHFIQKRYQRSSYWVLENYIPAEEESKGCASSVTYTTHGDYSFLDNVVPLLERWRAPLSMAIYAPGFDYQATVHSLIYLRNCVPKRAFVRKFASFHIYFRADHLPKSIIPMETILNHEVNCSEPAPYMHAKRDQMYKTLQNLTYPVNVGRNLARDASLTHYVLASDVELYPSLNLVPSFLKMIISHQELAFSAQPKVFVLPIFEVKENIILPRNKTILQKYVTYKFAIRFHQRICSECHEVPESAAWMAAYETEDLDVFATSKRIGKFASWEPIFIGTINDPYYEERLSWEGKADKMTQGYALCVLNYDFNVLNNAFLVHRPGIKTLKAAVRHEQENENKRIIANAMLPELQIIYGTRDKCLVL